MINTEKLKQVIEAYKADFAEHFEEERYKWEAVKCFQDNWDINADDFAGMLKNSFEKTYNLLGSMNYYPRRMIVGFAKDDSEATKNAFRMLFDESKDIRQRIQSFIDFADDRKQNHKLNINDTIALKVQRKQKLSCEFDEFSEDNLYNQILKVTMHRLIKASDVASERKQALKKLMVFFGNVSLILPDHIPWNRLIYQRNNRNYELLLNICYLVLNGMLQTTEDGSYKLLTFSDEHMERLYEKFILEYYKQHHPELKPKSAQVKWNLTEQPDETMIQFLPAMQTDITLQKDEKTLIIDAKYYGKSMIESYDKATLRSAHLYQIFAYVKNMDTKNTGSVSGLLLYAKTEEEVFPNGEPFIIGGNSIGARTLDLNQEFNVLASQLDDIVEDYFS